jgi:hypothetical protein
MAATKPELDTQGPCRRKRLPLLLIRVYLWQSVAYSFLTAAPSMKLSFFAFVVVAAACASAADSIPPIPRVLPPEGLEIPADVRSRLETRLTATKKRLEAIKEDLQKPGAYSLKPDVEIFTKAVELALLHREFYIEKDFGKADWALDEANKRLDAIALGADAWTGAEGLVVRGYYSKIDGSAQPYGLVVPKDHNFAKRCPVYVWLHGRGDKNTDLHFLYERATRPGQLTPTNAIVVHPFGRHCVGWKHAGEIDVLEVVENLRQRRDRFDFNRIVLIGFSMGGAGAWHIGAHYPDRWLAVSPGAGFAETARYQNLTPEKYPPSYEQKLWGLYDVPGYVRNLFNAEVIAYSGENDKQIQAARIMEEAFQSEGRTLTHLIGPGVEHKYEPKTLEELLRRLDAIVSNPPARTPDEVHLQTQTLRYPKSHWVMAEGLEEHWKDSRIDAERSGNRVKLETKNVNFVSLLTPIEWSDFEYIIDGQSVGKRPSRPHPVKSFGPPRRAFVRSRGLLKENDRWRWQSLDGDTEYFTGRKTPGQQGPIDDAFLSSFVVVAPTGKSLNPAFQRWCESELQHFRDRWRALMRAELPEVNDTQFDIGSYRVNSVILWGDPESNSAIRQLRDRLPVKFSGKKWSLGGSTYDGNQFVPVCIYPSGGRRFDLTNYLVLNSGLTFREGHDSTNSLQNPKLPDWAIIDMSQPPDAKAPGRIHDADFFDEQWRLKRQPKVP